VELSHNLSVTGEDYFQVLCHLQSGDYRKNALCHDADFLSNLLFYSVSISAWKQVQGTSNKWALRVNASSGNLHPTETHVAVKEIDGLAPGLYHYKVDAHALEYRQAGDQAERLWALTGETAPCPPVLLCLASVLWREVWKYRQRGFRYCQHDMGHALGAVLIASASLGWNARVFGLFCDDEVSSTLLLNEGKERPGLIIGLDRERADVPAQSNLSALARGDFAPDAGVPNLLSAKEIDYPIVQEVQNATCMSAADCDTARGAICNSTIAKADRPQSLVACAREIDIRYSQSDASAICLQTSAHTTIRKRRSAVDMDGRTRISLSQLTAILGSATRGVSADFMQEVRGDAPNSYLIDLFAYIHRVDDVTPGLYFVDRKEQVLVPLLERDQRNTAKGVSCFQDIAADGCFALSMIADMDRAWRLFGERGYKLVHYEAGMIGQMLYLAATALGVDATGIGCFVDDAINNYLALPDGQEVVYNFTFGGAVLDARLSTLPSYSFADPAVT
jgi:SagB-type dehydrogenase family enzyme